MFTRWEPPAAKKAEILTELAEAGATRVVTHFDGYGDEGFIDKVEANVELNLDLQEKVRDFVYDLLEATHGGWEINAGAFGEVTFDIPERSVHLDYNERYESVEYSEEDW